MSAVDHYENFPVASMLCPRALRPAVIAIYHYARTADDIADEGDATAAQRLHDLAAYRAELQQAQGGSALASPSGARWPAVFTALSEAITAFRLPPQPLHDLLDAFEQDVRNPTYADRAALLDYCRRSANPIGRLLMHLYGIDDATSLRQADAICTALQLINFWQDLSVDGPRRRHYVPLADARAHGITREALVNCEDSAAMRHLTRGLCDWARGLMLQGAALPLRVPGRAGWELRLVVQGGLRILDRIASTDHASIRQRPRLGGRDVPLLLWRAIGMRNPT